jgi:hypothetical protein
MKENGKPKKGHPPMTDKELTHIQQAASLMGKIGGKIGGSRTSERKTEANKRHGFKFGHPGFKRKEKENPLS